MGFARGLFKSLLNSIIISALFFLVAVSLFVGDFPPTVSQVKQVFNDYRSLINLKQKMMSKSGGQGGIEEFADNYVREHAKARQNLRDSRSGGVAKNPYGRYVDQVDSIGSEDGRVQGEGSGAYSELQAGSQGSSSGNVGAYENRGGNMGFLSGTEADSRTGVDKQVRNTASEAAKILVQDAPPSQGSIPVEWQEQFYRMRSEIFRLNQRVLELERKQAK